MINYYFQIPEKFASYALSIKEDANIFNAVRTKDNRLVCAANSMGEFISIFENESVMPLELTLSDFPDAPAM